MTVYNFTESTITRTSREEYEEAVSDVSFYYRSNIAPRSTSIPRRLGHHSSQRCLAAPSGSSCAALLDAAACKLRNRTALEVIEGSEREKRELAELNDKFASYMERVRFLEIHNKRLALEVRSLAQLRACGESKVGEMYEIEIHEAGRLVDEICADKARAEKRIGEVEDEADKFRKRYQELLGAVSSNTERIESLSVEIGDNEAEIGLLKRRLDDLQEEAKRYKTETQRLLIEIQRMTRELDMESLQHAELWKEKCDLEEELGLLRQTHANELQDLRQNCFQDSVDPSQYFKSELADVINDVRNEYELIINSQRSEMNHWYSLKVQEIDTRIRLDQADVEHAMRKTKELREQVCGQKRELAGMRAKNGEVEARIRELEELLGSEGQEGAARLKERDAEIQALRARQMELMSDFEALSKLKSTLHEEIKTYRRLLEGDSSIEGLKQVVEDIEQTQGRIRSGGVVLPIRRSTTPTSSSRENNNNNNNNQLLCVSEYSLRSEASYEEQMQKYRSPKL